MLGWKKRDKRQGDKTIANEIVQIRTDKGLKQETSNGRENRGDEDVELAGLKNQLALKKQKSDFVSQLRKYMDRGRGEKIYG